MRITYLLDRPEIGGGVKVVFQHAALLAERGHRVDILGQGPCPAWVEGHRAAGVTYRDRQSPQAAAGIAAAPPVDLLLATFWTTLMDARRAIAGGESGGEADPTLPRARAAASFLQGYEPHWPHQRHAAREIEAAYRAAALPAIVVARHLGETLEGRHDLPWRVAPPPVDRRFRPTRLPVGWLGPLRRPRHRPWIVGARDLRG